MSVVFIPVYIRMMGIESYGLVGIYVVLLGLSAIMDMGLGATANREVASLSSAPERGRRSGDLFRTLEILTGQPAWR